MTPATAVPVSEVPNSTAPHPPGPTRAQREKRFRTQKRQQQNENKHISRRKHARRRRGKHGGQGGELLRAHYAELARLAHTRAMAAFAPALTPMLATPPARVFAATNMLVCVLLLLLLCAERFFSLCSGRSRGLRSCRATGAGHRNGDCGGSVGHLGELWVMV